MDSRKPIAAAPQTASPARNFTIPLADRVRAAGGPLAYMTRRRQIEDLDAALLSHVASLLDQDDPAALDGGLRKRAVVGRLDRLNALIAVHNRWYPAEANLPLDPRTGLMLERGAPWRPLDPVTIDALVARARALRNP